MSDVTSADIKYYLNSLKDDLTLEETEDSWERITKAIFSFAGTCENGGFEAAPSEVINALRNFSRPLVSAMNSERTRLCGAAIDLLVSAATGLGREFEQLLTLFMPPLLALCGRTNKVVINRARTCIITIIESTQLASVLPYFLQNIKDKSASLRLIVAEGTLACLNSCNPPDLEKESRARDIESIIRGTARDANADVRKLSRKIFECYKILLPGRVDSFTAPLTPTMKKYLDIKTNGVSSQQLTSNVRANLNTKPNMNPSTSTSALTSIVARNPGHSRTASASATSTTSGIRNLAASLSRVSRKGPISTAPTPSIPVKSVPASRTTSESQTEGRKQVTATRPGSAQEVKRPVPPLRSQASVISRATTSAAPHRLPVIAGVKPTPPTSGPQSSASSGPRRVPMPPPPPPAPAKEKSTVTLKRLTSKADTAPASGQRPAVSTAPAKKPAVTITSSLTKVADQPKANKSTTSTANSSGNTKPLVINTKPLWGRSAPVSKAAATASQRAVPASKTLSKKPSSRQVSAPTSGASKIRPTTPALIALPPSPIPEDNTDTDTHPAMQKTEHWLDQNDDQQSEDKAPSSRQSPTPPIDGAEADDERQEVQEQAKTSPISSETIANPTLVNDGVNHGEPESHSNSSAMTPTDETPGTPQGPLLNPVNPSTAMSTAKTPISALLSSIQRGFIYSPSSPLSPADSYLLLGPHGTTTNKDRDAPIRPFNFALHPPSNHTFGKGMEEMALGDIGTVKVTDHKLFTPSALVLDDGPRQAFVDINK